ncbi:MAG: hypothetical protein GIS02_00155 [Methanosarcinales archaeon]|uniref:Uncharacterized protein n=1 Tax=Candidatus Ethanoperedens thermophilum TaxID=2766897 RepID=A0A848D5D5_9EURY|nr:hypothetical protein [Candidatus Ethanoperedens thermophilum]
MEGIAEGEKRHLIVWALVARKCEMCGSGQRSGCLKMDDAGDMFIESCPQLVKHG